jgi:hypothetical protein
MKWPCVEATLDIEGLAGCICRLWIEQGDTVPMAEKEARRIVTIVRGTLGTVDHIVDVLAREIPGLSAVQFMSDGSSGRYKQGVVYYVKDFTTDVHG